MPNVKTDYVDPIIEVYKTFPKLVRLALAILPTPILVLVAWRGPYYPSQSRPTNILIALAVGLLWALLALVYKNSSDLRDNILGTYYVNDDPNYVNTIRKLDDGVFRIINPAWEGVGLLDSHIYYGVYKYNDKALPQHRGEWGIHKAELCSEKGRWVLKISGQAMNAANAANLKSWGVWFRVAQ